MGERGKWLKAGNCLSLSLDCKKKVSKTAESFSGSKKNGLARLPPPGGSRVADSSGPRDGLEKRLRLMKIQESFLGTFLSKCK